MHEMSKWEFVFTYILECLTGLCVGAFISDFVRSKIFGSTEKRVTLIQLIAFLFFLYSVAAVVLIATGKGDTIPLQSPWIRALFCFFFIFWGFLYYLYQDSAWSMAFGIVQIVFATGSNWYQLKQLAENGFQRNLYDRLVFLAVGIAVIAKGWKDYDKGSKYYAEGVFIPRPGESEAARISAGRNRAK